MKLIKFLLALVITCFAFVSEATSDPLDQLYGIETIIYQNSNSDVLAANLCAIMESNGYGVKFQESQFLNFSNIRKVESNIFKFKDYCYISRHRRTKSLNSCNYIRTIWRCDNDKRDPLIRGQDSTLPEAIV